MRIFRLLLAAAATVSLPSCMTSRSDFAPEKSQVTVGMPAKLSERERSYISEVDRSLRNEGYMPVRYGAGDMQLEFEIAEGPINIDTTIELLEGSRTVAKGYGRAGGAPMIGRDKVANRSFDKAFGEFRSSLPGSSSSGGYGSHERTSEEPPQDEQYIY